MATKRTLKNSLFTTALIFSALLVTQCTPSQPSIPERFEKVPVNPSELNHFEVQLDGWYRHCHFAFEGDTLYIIQPFKSVIEVIDLNTHTVVKELPIRKTKKRGKNVTIQGGAMNDLVMHNDKFYAVENATAKVIEYDHDWNLIRTYHAPDNIRFSIDAPGIFEVNNDHALVSIDDVIGRWANRKQILQDEDPILVSVDLKNGSFKKVLTAGDLYSAVKSDSLPYFSMTSSEKGFYLTFEFDATLYHFNRKGKFLTKHDVFSQYINLEGYAFDDFQNSLGITDIFVLEDMVAYFIKRKDKKNFSTSFEVVCFELSSATYWTYTIPQKRGEAIRLLDFNNKKQLSYLIGREGESSIKTVGFTTSGKTP